MISLPFFLCGFAALREAILARAERPESYHATVATTWELSFVEVEKQSKAAAQLMNLCAFLAPDDIPRDMLQGGAKYLPKPLSAAVSDQFQWDEVVGALRRYSLTEASEDAVAVHRLVQKVARERLNDTEKKQWSEAAAKVVGTKARGEAWAKIDRELVEEAVAIPYQWAKEPYIESKDVAGINEYWNSGTWDYAYTSLK